MEDREIVALYWARSETAIAKTAEKYERYCMVIAKNILGNQEDSEECVNDTWLGAWNSLPPHKPEVLSTFLGKITRNLSLNRYAWNQADKRGGGEVPQALEELSECLPDRATVEQQIEDQALEELLNRFLDTLNETNRRIFLKRYWYLCPVKEIAGELGIGESRVKMSLMRTRKALKQFLEWEGVSL